MRLVLSYAALGQWNRGPRKLTLPLAVELPGQGSFTARSEAETGLAEMIDLLTEETLGCLYITAERTANPARLELVDDIFYELDEEGEMVRGKALATPDDDLLAEGAMAIVGSISFALGVPLQLSPMGGDEFRNELVPESAADQARLDELGTGRARGNVGPTTAVEAFGDMPVDSALIGELASRQVASVYSSVLAETEVSNRFLALWRTLEFAFQAEGKPLVQLLLDFPRVKEMEFDRPELEELRAIRGRLSHAVSRRGLRELRRANALAIVKVGRLWSLVDWVVLAKASPSSDDRCAPVADLRAFIDRAGRTRMIDGDEPAGRWLESWSSISPRFRS